jgi:hypothetical protein
LTLPNPNLIAFPQHITDIETMGDYIRINPKVKPQTEQSQTENRKKPHLV